MLDIKLVNGRIIDVQNRRIIEGDVGIKDGVITDVGSVAGEASVVIDAEGKHVSPGFVDIHMHEEDLSITGKKEYDIANTMLSMGVTTAVTGNCGDNKQSIEELAAFIDEKGNPVNYMSYVGHNYLREQAGNFDIYSKSTREQVDKMKLMVEKAVEFGAIGISYGLEYSPGTDVDEAVSVAEPVVGRQDLLLSAHYRKDAKYALDAIREMAEIANQTRVPFQISHLSSCSAYGNMIESLELIDKIVAAGTDIQVDAYPYDAFSTNIGSAVFDDGCLDIWGKGYDSIMLAEEPYRGMRCDEALFKKARAEYPDMLVIAYVMIEDEIIQALNNPNVMVASDGVYRAHQGHPRGAGTFPRVIGRYVRDKKAMDFFDAIYKMTQMPAKRLGLNNKGLIEPGFDGDIVVFDYDTILDKADFDNPQLKPEGIEHVIIGGKQAVTYGQTVCNRCGRFIRKNKY